MNSSIFHKKPPAKQDVSNLYCNRGWLQGDQVGLTVAVIKKAIKIVPGAPGMLQLWSSRRLFKGKATTTDSYEGHQNKQRFNTKFLRTVILPKTISQARCVKSVLKWSLA